MDPERLSAATRPRGLDKADDSAGVRVDEALVGFAAALRYAGLRVTADRVHGFVTAAATVGADDHAGLYWAGRATLCADPEDLPTFDKAFTAWFGGDATPAGRRGPDRPRVSTPRATLVDADTGQSNGDGDAEPLATVASTAEVLRHRDVADLDPSERAELARMFGRLTPTPPLRRSSRRRPDHRGELDLRRMLRDEIRRGGVPGPARYRRRGTRPRRVVLLIDVSGSMAPYADSLLRLAHRVEAIAPRRTEVFTLGTRLTRVTRPLSHRDADTALVAAGETVPDWSGGTRLGESLRVFLDRWGQRGLARGAVVVVFSDGWERGDCQVLAEQTARLARLAHRVVWSNPHRGKPGYAPVQAGIAAVLPHVDQFVPGHSMAAFDAVLEVIADA
jgi:uncharacterized protein with von Willebrand factor type A (vWA) domain